MSKTRELEVESSATIGRDALVGGRMSVSGSVTVGHNLKVKGWLDADNIKGANKGFFLTVEKLKEAYPCPQEGWIAGVGDRTPFAAYVVDEGEWRATGGTIVFETNFAIYDDYLNRMENVLSGLENVKINIDERLENIEITANQANNRSQQNFEYIRKLYEKQSFLRFVMIVDDAEIEAEQYSGRPNYYATDEEYIVYVKGKKVFAYNGRDGKYYKDWVVEYNDEVTDIDRHQKYNDEELRCARRDALFYEENSGLLYVVDDEGELSEVSGGGGDMAAITEEEINQLTML